MEENEPQICCRCRRKEGDGVCFFAFKPNGDKLKTCDKCRAAKKNRYRPVSVRKETPKHLPGIDRKYLLLMRRPWNEIVDSLGIEI